MYDFCIMGFLYNIVFLIFDRLIINDYVLFLIFKNMSVLNLKYIMIILGYLGFVYLLFVGKCGSILYFFYKNRIYLD